MYFVSVTRLGLRSFFLLPRFMMANEASIKYIRNTPGFVDGKELIDKGLTFWTVTVWESDAAMKAFRNNDPHRAAMRKLPEWCDEAAYVHWTQEDNIIPDWDILHERLLGEGRLTKVKYPSIQQGVMAYPQPKWKKIERPIKPVFTRD